MRERNIGGIVSPGVGETHHKIEGPIVDAGPLPGDSSFVIDYETRNVGECWCDPD